MAMTHKSFSEFVPSTNLSPDLVVIECSFMGKDGRCQAVDNDLYLELYNYGSNTLVVAYALDNATNKINVTSKSSGLYYYAKVDPTPFTSDVILAKWYAKVGGLNYQPYPVNNIVNIRTQTEDILLPSTIRDYVIRSLGFPNISVELDDTQINQSMEQVLSIYNKWLPKIGYGNIDLIVNQSTYTITAWGKGVIAVDFVRKEGMPFINDPLFGKQYPKSQVLDFDQFVLGISFYKTLLKQTGQDPSWKWDKSEPNKLRIFIRNATGYYVTYKYLADNRLEEINPAHHQIIKDYVLAKSMIILGRIRSKFGNSVMTPTGDKSLDGDTLMTQGLEKEKELEEKLQAMAIRVPPMRY